MIIWIEHFHVPLWKTILFEIIFPVAILEFIFLILQMSRELLRGRLLVRLGKFEYIRIFFEGIKKKIEFSLANTFIVRAIDIM